MKTLLIATTALAAALLAAGQASAAEKVKISLGGYMNVLVHSTNQDVDGFAAAELRDVGILTEGEIHFKGKTTLDNGIEVGTRVELEIESDNSSGGQSANNDIVDELYIYAQGAFGRVEIGQQDGIADQFGIPPPRPFRAASVDDPEVFFIQDGTENPYRPNSLRLRTDNFVSDDNTKIIYMTPRWAGVQLGISYMPEPTKNVPGFGTRRDNNPDQQSEIWEAGANYDGTIGDEVGLKAYIVYLTGSIEAPTDVTVTATSPWVGDDLQEWGAGATVKFGGFSVGAAYRESNGRGGQVTTVLTSGSDYSAFSVAAAYNTGPWTFSGQYIAAETDITQTVLGVGQIFTQDGDAFELGVMYELSTGVNLAVGYQNYQYENDNPLAVDNAQNGDLDADVAFFGVNIEM